MAWKRIAFYDEVAVVATGASVPVDITPDATSSVGTGSTAAAYDHVHAITAIVPGTIAPDAAAAEGTSTGFSRGDHVHGITTIIPGTIGPDDAAAEGTSTGFTRGDHVHGITTAAPSAVDGTAVAEGTATAFVRSDHRHALGPLLANLDYDQFSGVSFVLQTVTAQATDTSGQPDSGVEKKGQIWFSSATGDLHAYIWTSTT